MMYLAIRSGFLKVRKWLCKWQGVREWPLGGCLAGRVLQGQLVLWSSAWEGNGKTFAEGFVLRTDTYGICM